MKESLSLDSVIGQLVNGGFFLEEAVEILEKGMIAQVLNRHANNQSEAAKALGIHRNTLLRKMVAYNIDGKRPRPKPASRAERASKAKPKQQRRGRTA